MAATRLSDAQKQEIVERYRQGETSTALAVAYGCSANTVSRVLKAALAPDDYERLKQQRGRAARAVTATAAPVGAPSDAPLDAGTAAAVGIAVAPVAVQAAAEDAVAQGEADETVPQANASGDEPAQGQADQDQTAADGAAEDATAEDATAEDEAGEDAAAEDDDGPGVLAIDDADDFGDDEADTGSEVDGDDGDDDDAVVEARAEDAAAGELVQCQALIEAELPGSAYMLVDKVVELQPTALRDCTDLGPLPEEEADRQALQVYLNPRQAKRYCGRSQRVIKVPDLRVFQRTAPYLLAKGISRVVIEGSIYSLPGS